MGIGKRPEKEQGTLPFHFHLRSRNGLACLIYNAACHTELGRGITDPQPAGKQ
ncbi:MAG TPA: hypothetical protein PKE07_14810 [Lacibacter sp.]|nr:hypothetical protein [Lacibacter sp.]HMO90484.1 hypothetical protein [Lacibacter sp.]